MSHAASCSLWNRLPAHAVSIACMALLAAASPAHAGFGDLVKKAQDKVTKKAAPAAPCKAIEYDEVVLELTN